MKYITILLLLFITSCSVENITATEDIQYERVEEDNSVESYCENYSSHLVPGSKKDNSYQGCIDAYSKDY